MRATALSPFAGQPSIGTDRGITGGAITVLAERKEIVLNIHIHSSAEAGIFANAFAIETTKSVVVVDALLTPSEARAFAEELHAIEKPISGVLISFTKWVLTQLT